MKKMIAAFVMGLVAISSVAHGATLICDNGVGTSKVVVNDRLLKIERLGKLNHRGGGYFADGFGFTAVLRSERPESFTVHNAAYETNQLPMYIHFTDCK